MAELRQLQLDDIPAALELSAEAGWNQTADDWRMLLERDAAGCLALECEGQLAATTTLACYGTQLGWIGMVLTRERFRRRGYARLLLQRAMELAQARGIQTLKLDATELGVALYGSLGFEEEQAVERWRGEVERVDYREQPARGAILEELDAEAFGADRGSLLQALAGRGSLTSAGAAFAMTRPGRVARYLGPCVARDGAAGRRVIESALSGEGAWYWDLLPANAAAVEIARALGFVAERRLRRMSFGKALRGCDEMVLAIGGFEIG